MIAGQPKGRSKKELDALIAKLDAAKLEEGVSSNDITTFSSLITLVRDCYWLNPKAAVPTGLFGRNDKLDIVLRDFDRVITRNGPNPTDGKIDNARNYKKKVIVEVTKFVAAVYNEIMSRLDKSVVDDDMEKMIRTAESRTDAASCARSCANESEEQTKQRLAKKNEARLKKSKQQLWLGSHSFEESLEWLAENVNGVSVHHHQKNKSKKRKAFNISSKGEMNFVGVA